MFLFCFVFVIFSIKSNAATKIINILGSSSTRSFYIGMNMYNVMNRAFLESKIFDSENGFKNIMWVHVFALYYVGCIWFIKYFDMYIIMTRNLELKAFIKFVENAVDMIEQKQWN